MYFCIYHDTLQCLNCVSMSMCFLVNSLGITSTSGIKVAQFLNMNTLEMSFHFSNSHIYHIPCPGLNSVLNT